MGRGKESSNKQWIFNKSGIHFHLINENKKKCTLKDHSTWFICKKCYIWALITKYVLGFCFPNTPDHLYVCAGWVFVGARDIYLQITKARGPPSRLDLHRAHSFWTGGESWQTQQLWFMETITPWDLWHASRCGASWGDVSDNKAHNSSSLRFFLCIYICSLLSSNNNASSLLINGDVLLEQLRNIQTYLSVNYTGDTWEIRI